MKKYTLSAALWTTLGLFGASEGGPEEVAVVFFEKAKLAIAMGKEGALDGLSKSIVKDHQEEVKQLLEYALRSQHENNKEYVNQLVEHLKIDAEDKSLMASRVRSPSFRRSETLTLMDIAIMKGDVDDVKKLLELKPDLSRCRLVSGHKVVSTSDALASLIHRMKNNDAIYSAQSVHANLDQLEQIKKLIDEYDAKKPGFKFRNIFKKKK